MRDEVQRWLSACIMAGYDTPDGDTSYASFEVDAPTLEALCRRWLAVEDAPVGWVSGADMESAMQTVVMDKWPGSVRCGHDARVRIVPEAGLGESHE